MAARGGRAAPWRSLRPCRCHPVPAPGNGRGEPTKRASGTTRTTGPTFVRALAQIDPDMAVNIEPEDANYSRLDRLALGAENLRAATAQL